MCPADRRFAGSANFYFRWFDSWASMVAASDAWVHQMIRELVGYPFGGITNIQGDDDLLLINQIVRQLLRNLCQILK